jgi:hypothetical protein
MKNLLLATILLVLTFALVGCGGGSAANTTAANKPANSAPANTAPPANTAKPDNANAKPDTAKSDAPTGGDQDFKLDNKTGVEIHAVFVSAHDENEWGNDILGRDTLPDGGTVDIKFSPKEKAQFWDIRVEDADGNFIVWEKLNLLEISTVRLNYKDGKATAFVE